MKTNNNNTLRLIGGKWRSRKLHFAPQTNIRPTTDFVRETLFNWLAPYINEANCLDLFAGSGALGFEALSRGAKKVTFMDQASQVIRNLQQNAEILATENVEFYCQKFTPTMQNSFMEKFDIVFIDPPFKQNLINPVCEWLVKNNCLVNKAFIYLENERKAPQIILPSNWQLFRQKTSGQVAYALYRSNMPKQEDPTKLNV